MGPTLLALPFPAIDPVAVSIGPIAIRWYALAYIVGLVGGWWLARRLAARADYWAGLRQPTATDIDDLIEPGRLAPGEPPQGRPATGNLDRSEAAGDGLECKERRE